MIRFKEVKPISPGPLTVWQEISGEDTATLTIFLHNGKKITPEEQFWAFYEGRQIRYPAHLLRIKFFMTFYDATSLYLMHKIKNLKTEIAQLADLENWVDETKNTSENEFTNKSDINSDSINLTKGASTDNNSQTNVDVINQFFDLKATKPSNITLATSINQNISSDISHTGNTGGGDSKTTSNLKSSNLSTDLIASINLQLPSLRDKFWRRFEYLFI